MVVYVIKGDDFYYSEITERFEELDFAKTKLFDTAIEAWTRLNELFKLPYNIGVVKISTYEEEVEEPWTMVVKVKGKYIEGEKLMLTNDINKAKRFTSEDKEDLLWEVLRRHGLSAPNRNVEYIEIGMEGTR